MLESNSINKETRVGEHDSNNAFTGTSRASASKLETYKSLQRASNEASHTWIPLLKSASEFFETEVRPDDGRMLAELELFQERVKGNKQHLFDLQKFLSQYDLSLIEILWDIYECMDENNDVAWDDFFKSLKHTAEDPGYDFLRLLFLYERQRYDDIVSEFRQCHLPTHETVILFVLACKVTGRNAYARGALNAIAEAGDADFFTQNYLEILRQDLPQE
jgi:hypothetical protein